MPPTRLPLTAVMVAAAAIVACGGDTAAPDDAAAPAAAEADQTPEPMAAIDAAILDLPGRSEDDHYRDEGFKPLEVYGFLGIAPGITVAELMPSRGYNTVLVSQIVGETGKVVGMLRPRPEEDPERIARSRTGFEEAVAPFGLENVEMVDDPTQVADASVDMILTVRNYHDLGEGPERTAALPEYMRMLRPGGTFAIIDAYTDKPDERDETVHRINGDLVRAEMTAAGFEFVAQSDVLMNPDDTYDFDGRERAGRRGATEDAPIHRYFVSRFVHQYRKPAE